MSVTMANDKALSSQYSKFIRELEIENLYAESASFELKNPVTLEAPMSIKLKDTPKVRELSEDHLVAEHAYRLDIKERRGGKALVVVKATFVVVYVIGGTPPDDVLRRFLKKNVRVNTWPFFREVALSSLARMNLPPLVLPALKG